MNRLKRTLAALTAALVCTVGTPAVLPTLADTVVMTASAFEKLTYGDLTYEVNYQGTIVITGCDESAEVVEIPAEIDGKAVTGIFNGDISAFSGCTSLTSITIPESVTFIDEHTFVGCTNLTSIEVDSGNESYTSEDNILFSKDKSVLVCYPGGKKEERYVIPESVTKIGALAFYDHTNLTSITIPEGVTEIDYCAFEDCTSLTSITIPEGVTKIVSQTFSGCTSLTSVTIPESVTMIDWYAFSGCTSLTSITIPEGVTEFESGVFNDCTSLTSITLPESIMVIGEWAFGNCTSLTDVYYTGTAEQWNAIKNYSDLTAATIHFNSTTPVEHDPLPGGLTYEINDDGTISITGCDKSAEDVEIPAEIDGKAVTDIFREAFSGYTSLTSITIPESVTGIDWGAFYGCTSLTSITIPESVTEIGSCAFYGCTNLTSIVIPESVTVIGYRTFEGCTSLTSITIPESVTEIGYLAFSGCEGLADVYYTGTEEQWNVIENYELPIDATIHFNSTAPVEPDPLPGNLEYQVNDDGTISITGCDKSAEFIEIPAEIDGKAVTEISYEAFSGCTSLTSITIPESVTGIDSVTFADCISLTSITIPKSVKVIGREAFVGCTSLASITIPESVTWIGACAFVNCTSLTSIQVDSGNANYVSEDGVLFNKDESELICCPGGKEGVYVIPESMTKIGDYAFQGCTSLTSVMIPESVTMIGLQAFYDCTSLTSITIPESVTVINMLAFSDCEVLTDVYYTGTEEQWNSIEIYYGNEPLESATIHYNSTAPVEPDTPLGDINGDNTINASDAAVVLIAAAQIGAGEGSGLTEAQRKAADVNKDGKINASDAAVILMYAAAVGAGDENAKIEDFV